MELVTLHVSDDGVGFPPVLEIDSVGFLGLRLPGNV
jgi:signal transduction histidine kinase